MGDAVYLICEKSVTKLWKLLDEYFDETSLIIQTTINYAQQLVVLKFLKTNKKKLIFFQNETVLTRLDDITKSLCISILW